MLIEPPSPHLPGRAVIEDMQSSTGRPREMTKLQIDDVRRYLNADLFAFNWLIFGHTDLIGPLHGELCNLINLWGWIRLKDGTWTRECDDPDKIEANYRRIMIQIPREFFKTSVCTRANALWQLCREPDLPVMIVNERLDNAKKWMAGIRNVVESSELFQIVYRDLLPPGVARDDPQVRPQKWKWSDIHMDFQGKRVGEAEYSLSCNGIQAATAGGHWPKIIKDDLISEDAAHSPEVMEKAKEWLDKSYYLERPAQRGMDLINCTRWAWGDVYDYAARQYNYLVYTRSALEAPDGTPDPINGESIFPKKLSTKELRKQYKRDPVGFSSQMQNHPKAGKDTSFEMSWVRGFEIVTKSGRPHIHIPDKWYDPDLTIVRDEDLDYYERAPQTFPLSWLSATIILDPAQSRKSQKQAQRYARHGVIAAGLDPYGRRFVLEAAPFRAEPKETLETVIEMCLSHGIRRVAIEEVAFSEVYRHFLAYMLEKDPRYKNLSLDIIPVEPAGRNKDSRVLSMIPFFRQGFYYCDPSLSRPLLQELQEYPYGMTVDCVDALAYLTEAVSRPETPTEMETSHARRAIMMGPDSGRDEVTGY